jgi:hypothetical protein
MAIPRRGLQYIRTLSGRVRKATLPHEAYLRISHIEMEKARKTQESEKARQMMTDISARIQEIEDEKDVLLQALGERNVKPSRGSAGPPEKGGGFKIKY